MEILHYDKKLLTPFDRFGTAGDKSVRGFVVVENDKGIRKGENLVVLGGREFLASKLLNLPSPAFANSNKYEIRYFGIGKGGASADAEGNLTVKTGPFSNDIDLYEPWKISNGNSSDGFTYIHNGYLKNIATNAGQGSGYTFITENHEIETADGTINVSAYTIVKFTMFLTENEMTSERPFEFNEAGLWAVEYNSEGKPVLNVDGTANRKLFAHFTTCSKFLENTDVLKIEWYILL